MLDDDPILRTKVARLKEAHSRWNRRMVCALGIWLIAGAVAGVGTWFIQKPIDRDATMFGGALGVGVGTFLLGCLITRMILPRLDAKCPRCGHHWEGDQSSEDWRTWNCCPGCGLRMTDDKETESCIGPREWRSF
jgi:hypothetical protein